MVLTRERSVVRNSNTVVGCFHQFGCFVVIMVFWHGIRNAENIFEHKLNKAMNFVQGGIATIRHQRCAARVHTEVEDMEHHKDAKKLMKDVVAEEIHRLTYLHFFVGTFATIHIVATEVKKATIIRLF
jgi:hypothetical protein